MEAMEDDRSDVKDDHNHNYFAGSSSKVQTCSSSQQQPVCIAVPGGEGGSARSFVCRSALDSEFMDSDTGTEAGYDTECATPAPASAQDKLTLDSTSKFRLNATDVEDYRHNHWPNLEQAIERLLIQKPTDQVSVSYAQIYSYVYKCVCQQHSELLYNDLKSKIANHLQRVSTELNAVPLENLIESFNTALTQYISSLHCIVPVFLYLNKFYIESKLNRDLKQDLMNLFADHVAEKYVDRLMSHMVPFKVQPSTMASVVTGLYTLRPDWALLAPALFSDFIPQINPPTVESLLLDYAARDQKLQLELSMSGFPRGDQSLKRASDEP
ncbi:CDK2-associated and cullin domain-containing protein 1 isoform X2 [Festucalex cinctus]